ncbi:MULTISPECIES: CHAT domain-containing protein [unclassified Microcoleus]|uniref:CHAT domain-containing protein n=1 Tax=unclassified Microcoleus TaxID=2642155 RepID=UPI0025DE3A9E|nr:MULTISPECIES: CHAT domain-containing protein [unclassified Microcoleus]
MNSERQQAYLNLINQLLNSPSGEEAEVLKTHPELLDDGLVAAMLEEADNLREFGVLDNANRLMNCAGMLLGRNNNSSVAVTRQATANILNAQAIQQHRISQFREALQSWEEALTIYKQIGDRQGEAASIGNLGLAYYSLGQYHKAIKFHHQSCKVAREIGDRKQEANSLGNSGLVYYSLGQYDKAIEDHKQSLVIKREIGDRQGEANSLCNLGNAYDSLGQYDKAIEFHEQSRKVSEEIGYRKGEANSLGNLGTAYQSLGEYDKAIKSHQQSLDISREIGDRQAEAISIGNLGKTYQSLGQYGKVIKSHQQSLDISREIGDRQGEAISIGNLGLAYYSRGQYDKAIEFSEQSLVISREIGDRVGESISFSNLGVTLFKNNQLAEAELTLYASIKIRETLRSELINDDHKISFFETQADAYRLLQKVLVAQTKFDEALEISEMGRTRAFVELLQKTLSPNDFATNEITNKLSIPKIQQIARDRNSTIVEYSIIDSDNLYIWVIQPNGNITHRTANLEPLNQQNQTLKQIILKTRVSIGTNETDDQGNKIQLESQYKQDVTGGFPLLQLLHQILIEPIIDLLPTDANSPIIFIPHYDLFLVPFAALQDSNNRYLIENHTILTSPSIQVLELTREHQNRVRGLRQAALIVGDPTIAPKFKEKPYELQQLSRAKEAAEAIAATLGTQAISGENATKVAILDKMLNTRIVHLSAHGLLDDFQGSGIPGAIILAPSGDDDGAIHAVDILQLKLDSELVVLSACSTGRGKITGDGVIGLSRCFILAGVPSIIVSLWNMGVISAKLLMTEFYQNLARGDDRAAALRCAMLTTKARFPSPIAWAAFTLIGETETLPLSTAKIDLRSLKMSLPDDAKPEEIVAAFSKLLKISEPQFVAELSAIDVGAMDNVNVIAERIKDWCETKPQIEENLENEIYQMGAGGTDSDAPEEVVREFYETLKENQIRLGLSGDSVAVEAPAVGEEGPGGG